MRLAACILLVQLPSPGAAPAQEGGCSILRRNTREDRSARISRETAWLLPFVLPVVLAGAIPISPQGAGVMEFFAINLTKQHGVSVGEAFALTMSIRVVQMLWNLTGGFFVFRGGYHSPSEKEQEEMEIDEEVPAC